ncbi:GINS complex subunit Psf3 [Schizosaccharomyces japonicus yFS275]|uniref:DNA replication complex GINS protein PSF3 n=1 Tax=Schizosaccharomyces japonicus (strain yFS275 / FY16936) TaxID=402676 RepID=B6JVX0_SCHJY|nr:GINS complex subunit Psf3 [Schizosaccharomyces japonicus yFS275]EEB05521.1 GINS complex subunit Psf3 [Schizosaccharomyces japonicus yFS275]
MSYYDIDSIIAENQKIPCTCLVSIPGLGHEGREVSQGSKVELPFWLAEVFAVNSFVDIHMPPPFSSVVRNALKANPNTVALRDTTTHFYHFAEQLLHVVSDTSLAEVVLDTLRQRSMEIADAAVNPQGAIQQNNSFIEGLDDFERLLFRLAYLSHRDIARWQKQN